MDAPKIWFAGVNATPEKLHNRTSIVLAALARMAPSRPASSVLGHLGLTGSPADTPVRKKVWAAQVPFGSAAKLSEPVPDKLYGAKLAVTVNTPRSYRTP
jgi:hypothetical protein